jgi:hypothetical protein
MDATAQALRTLTAVLAALQIPYLIGGSVASSARGVLRATMDVDLLVRLPAEDAPRLAGALGSDWYADPDAMWQALVRGRPFNVIHKLTGDKFDFFPAVAEFHAEELKRAQEMEIRLGDDTLRLPVASVEDIILAKLQWYRAGGEVSERQWSDVQNLLTTNSALDWQYLATWAERLGIQRLLARAAGQPESSEPAG